MQCYLNSTEIILQLLTWTCWLGSSRIRQPTWWALVWRMLAQTKFSGFGSMPVKIPAPKLASCANSYHHSAMIPFTSLRRPVNKLQYPSYTTDNHTWALKCHVYMAKIFSQTIASQRQNIQQCDHWFATFTSFISTHWPHTHTHTHTTILRLSGFCPGQPRWAGTRRTFIYSHLSWSSVIPYLLPPSIMINGILAVQFTCLTVLFHNLSLSFLWSTCYASTLDFIFHTFLHPIIIFFSSTSIPSQPVLMKYRDYVI